MPLIYNVGIIIIIIIIIIIASTKCIKGTNLLKKNLKILKVI
ncbi:MAG: hypothetical protein K7J15_03520 [Candidatus Regiella insecticola]|nr:hypothetical protein [Candidatus Regiella insecticola]